MESSSPGEKRSPSTQWHAIATEEALQRLESERGGLSEEEARRRLERDGPNSLRPPTTRSSLQRLLAQFRNLLIYVLIAAAVVTAFLQQWLDAGVIMGVVIINAIIGYIQEGKAEDALEAIRGMLALQAVVFRNGRMNTINAEEVVRGDVVFLKSGDKVGADARLLEVKNLQIDEAVLTGESVPVGKSRDPVEEDSPLGDRKCMAYSGTLVTQGQGRALVVATGDYTELGRISGMVSDVEGLETPLLRQVRDFSRTLTIFILTFAAFTFGAGYLILGHGAAEMFMAAVGLAVAAIPEGLPAIITITLSIGVQKMARRNAIIRRLPAVETLGSVTVICSDKTGTLTRNEMTVKTIATPAGEYHVEGVGYDPVGEFFSAENRNEQISVEEHPDLEKILRIGVLCNDSGLSKREESWTVEGDPTEGALLVAASKAGFDMGYENEAYPRTDVIPFESSHKYMATMNHDHESNWFISLKGAPERIFEMCNRQWTPDGGEVELAREEWEKRLEEIALRGQRLLGFAYRPVSADHGELKFDSVEQDMIFLGLVGIIDPPREEAIEAVKQCKEAGIRSVVITGDYAPTARAVARDLGIGGDREPLTGRDVQNMDDDEFLRAAGEVDVYARTSPEHKLRLVKALQQRNEIVAMTGDGVNDAPALKQADIGVAMGVKGTEAAKEASEMVLTDDNFATIARAVEEGRGVYDNLKKALMFMLPTNGGQALAIIVSIFLTFDAMNRGLGNEFLMPITPVQILWINMITTVTLALPLAFQPRESGVMQRPPRSPDQSLLTGFLIWRIAIVSILMVVGAIGHFYWMLEEGASLAVARSAAINTLVAVQVLYLFNSRLLLESSLRLRAILESRAVLVAVAALVVLQGLFTYAPFMQTLFGTAAIDQDVWGRIIVYAFAVFLLLELEKAVLRKHKERSG